MLTARFARPSSMVQSMDRLVQSVFGEEFFAPAARAFPALNVFEDDSRFVVEGELPGFSLDKLDITLKNGELTISGDRTPPAAEGVIFHRRERQTGRFTRSLRLATPIDADKVSATLTDGILTITLPKAEAARPRRIEIRPQS